MFPDPFESRVSGLAQTILMSFEVYLATFTLRDLDNMELKARRKPSDLAMEK